MARKQENGVILASWKKLPDDWRTASGQEVDIVLEDSAGRVVGIEIKASATLGGGDVRGLQAMAHALGKRWVRGVVLYTGTEVIPFAANLHGLPVSHMWAARG
jgi:predicted AAA+ superfamily ATPase